MNASPRKWRSVAALAEVINNGAEHKTLTDHAIRHLVRKADTNGLDEHVRRLGRKVLIDENGFRNWLDRTLAGNSRPA